VSAGDGRAYCPGECRGVVRTRQGAIRPHYKDGARCSGSDQLLIPPAPPTGAVYVAPLGTPMPDGDAWQRVGDLVEPPTFTDRCAHSSSMRLGDRRVCADCGEPRP
jgi:hypothetical protein